MDSLIHVSLLGCLPDHLDDFLVGKPVVYSIACVTKSLLASTIKSVSGVILNDRISGAAITTFGFPPIYGNFASMSPRDRVTASLPGNTLHGPRRYGSSSPS